MTRSEQTLAIISAIGELAYKLTGEPLVFDVSTANGTQTIIAGQVSPRRAAAHSSPPAGPASVGSIHSERLS